MHISTNSLKHELAALTRRRPLPVLITIPDVKARHHVLRISMLMIFILYTYFLWRTHTVLDTLESHSTSRRSVAHLEPTTVLSTTGAMKLDNLTTRLSAYIQNDTADKYIVFKSLSGGQGMGNVMAGLLAAHLFGLEFNRTVCVSNDFTAFHSFFEPVTSAVRRRCQLLFSEGKNLPLETLQNSLHIVNFYGPPNECILQEKLSSDVTVFYYRGNTYPRWPVVPDQFFFQHYRAKPSLLNALPYSQSPRTVVHLRKPDNPKKDPRKGLDEETFHALAKVLQETMFDDTDVPYLVTNEATWFDFFQKKYNWNHPPWNSVFHTGLKKLGWGVRDANIDLPGTQENELQMWCDWYTLLTAQRVFHTASDFSISAIHWNNILDSKAILGWNGTDLLLRDETWRVDGETAPLMERTKDAVGTSQLRHCHLPWNV